MPKQRKLKSWMPLLTLFLGVGVMGAMREDRAGGDIVWARTLNEGWKQAQNTGSPVLLSFHTPGCGWCQKLDAETYTDSRVVALSHSYVCLRVDSDMEAAATQQYGVSEFPTTILADAQGHELTRFSGYVPPDRYAAALQAALSVFQSKPLRPAQRSTETHH